MALDTNLVSYWKLDESSGNAADSVGSNTLTNTSVTYGAGKISNAAIFSTADLTGAANITGTGDMTVAFWVNITSLGSGTPTIAGEWFDPYNFLIYNNTSGAILAQLNGGGAMTTGNVISTGTWYHIAVTRSGTNGFLYLNGSQVATIGSLSAISTPTSQTRFGRTGADYFTGKLDEIGIWTRALTSGEITSLYNSGNGLTYPFIINIPFTISESLSLSETVTNLRTRLFTISETTTLSETVTALKGIFFTIAEDLGLTEMVTFLRSRIITVTESLGLVEVAATVTKTWENLPRHVASFTNKVRNSSIFTNKPKH